jgi:hypothetical protein
MCQSTSDTIKSDCIEKKYRLADFFNAHWESYIKDHKVPITREQYKAVQAIRTCRTAALGIDYYVCSKCGEVKEIYHNCKHRFCPTCSWGDTIKWAAKLAAGMMDVPHRHVVFTVPHSLHPLVKSNDKKLLNILMRCAAETLKDWAEHKYKLKIGLISVLHTFGEEKEYHLHVHMIVSWGGIQPETGKLEIIKGDYVNYKFIRKKFRIKFEDSLVSLYKAGELKHNFADEESLLKFFSRINKKNWVIHIEPPMSSPQAVIRYIGRYSKRACLSEYKITEIDGDFISFRHKDYRLIGEDNRPIEKILRMHYKEFFPRLLQHVPLPYFRIVRYYGLYSTKSNIPEEYLNRNTQSEEEEREWENPFVCSFCGQEREYALTVIDIRPARLREVAFDINIHPSYVYKRA